MGVSSEALHLDEWSLMQDETRFREIVRPQDGFYKNPPCAEKEEPTTSPHQVTSVTSRHSSFYTRSEGFDQVLVLARNLEYGRSPSN